MSIVSVRILRVCAASLTLMLAAADRPSVAEMLAPAATECSGEWERGDYCTPRCQNTANQRAHRQHLRERASRRAVPKLSLAGTKPS